MREDKKLKTICIIMTVVGIVLLIPSLTITMLFTSECACDGCKLPIWLDIVLNIFIWLGSGIAASSFTIVVSKKFDFSNKKNNLMKEYLAKSIELYEIIKKIRPCQTYSFYSSLREPVLEYEKNSYLLDELTKMLDDFDENSDDRKILEKIYDAFKQFDALMEMPIAYFKICLIDGPAYGNESLRDFTKVGFEKKDDGFGVHFYNNAVKLLYPLLKDLKLKVNSSLYISNGYDFVDTEITDEMLKKLFEN